MANKSLFSSRPTIPVDTVNEAGGVAYSRSAQEALTQFALTGTFNSTYYVAAEDQLKTLQQLIPQVEPEYVAKLAVYARDRGFMKDTPAYLLAALSSSNVPLTKRIFTKVIDNGKMLRNYAQVIRSGVTGRKSFGTALRNLIAEWILSAEVPQLISASVGKDPSLSDIIKMVHPKPKSYEQGALLAWIMGKVTTEQQELLPRTVKQLEAFRADPTQSMPNVPFELLTSTPLTTAHWMQIAKHAGWHMTRMNLNTFGRNKVYDNKEMVELIVNRLTDKEQMKRARVFPYQCLTAWLNIDTALVPSQIAIALQDILDDSLANIPKLSGNTMVLVDVSGSMDSPITGARAGATTKMNCVTVAALIASALLKKNPATTRIIPFNTQVWENGGLNPRDSLATNTRKIAKMLGGGTSCGKAMVYAYTTNRSWKIDQVIMVSDNESWLDNNRPRETDYLHYWKRLKVESPNAKLVCIDLTPSRSVQAPSESPDVLNIGGFSDNVFTILCEFVKGQWNPQFWVNMVKAVELPN